MKAGGTLRGLLRYTGVALSWCARAILGVVLAAVAYQTFIALPVLRYDRRSPAVRHECMQIHPGMNLEEVLRVVSREAEPMEQVYENGRFTFASRDLQCVVHFEEGAGRVVRVEVVQPEITFEPEDF